MKLPFFRQFSPGMQIVLFFSLHFLGYMVAQVVLFLVARPFWHINVFTHPNALLNFEDPSVLWLHRVMFIIFSVFVFITPVLVFRKLMELPDQDYLFTRRRIKLNQTWVMLAIFILVYPAINFLQGVNGMIEIPGETGKKIEEMDLESQLYVYRMLFDTNVWVMVCNLLTIALLPAIAEELFFRSVILRLFSRSFKNIHVAVWMGALFFSLYHFQWDGFIPRLFMGALLGYIFLITGNIWYGVVVHFLNNAFIVVLQWMAANDWYHSELDEFGMHGWQQSVGGVCIALLVCWCMYSWRKAKPYQMESELLYR